MGSFNYNDVSTLNSKGEKITEEEARIKYADIQRKNINYTDNMKLKIGFAQGVISAVGIGLSAVMQDATPSMVVNGVSIPITISLISSLRRAGNRSKKALMQLEDGTIVSALEKMEEIEKLYVKVSDDLGMDDYVEKRK